MLKFAGDFHVKMNTSYFQVYNKYLKSNNAWQNLHHTTYQRELSAQGADIYIEVSLGAIQILPIIMVYISINHSKNCFIIWYPHPILIVSHFEGK